MSNKKFLKGAFILASAGLLAKFLGIFFKIPLQRLIHDEGMGLFGLPYPIYTVLLSVSIIGFPAALSKLISEKLAIGDYRGAKKIFNVSFIMLLIIGLASSAILFLTAKHIIVLLKWPIDSYYSIVGLSLAPLFVSIMSAFRGYFQGLQIMTPTAISQIIEQIGRVVFGIVLAYVFISKGIGYAAGAASFGASIGAFLGSLVLLVCYIKYHRKFPIIGERNIYIRESTSTIIRNVLWIAFPITIGAVLSSIMGLIDSVIVISRLLQSGYSAEGATILYGQLTGKAVTLMNVPLTFSMAMAASLVPAISESFSKKNIIELREKAAAGLKTTIIIALPASIGLALLSSQIVHLLWGKTEAGGDILKVLAINVLFIALAQTLTGVLQGINKVFLPVRNLIVGVIIKMIVSNILLVTHLNILGTVIGSIVGYFVITILNFIALRRAIGIKIHLKEMIILPLIAASIMSVVVLVAFNYINTIISIESIATLGAIFIGVVSYFTILIVSGTISLKKEKFIK